MPDGKGNEMSRKWLLAGVLVLAGCGTDRTAEFIAAQTTTVAGAPTTASTIVTTTVTTTTARPTTAAPTTAPPSTTAAMTAGQRNAVRSAESYLKFGAFSRLGLINQLLFEKYTEADATFAVDNVKVDWNNEAAESAKSYLKSSAFSRQGLINQLLFEKFTPEQAAYGVTAAGL